MRKLLKITVVCLGLTLGINLPAQEYIPVGNGVEIASPNGRYVLKINSNDLQNDEFGEIKFCIVDSKIGRGLFNNSIGLRTDHRNFSGKLRIVGISDVNKHVDEYKMLTGKRRFCSNSANECTVSLVNEKGDSLRVLFRAYNDGLAFRYILPEINVADSMISENTAYFVPNGMKRWIQPYTPEYEGFYPLAVNGCGSDKGRANCWGYPALIEVADSLFALITEAGMERNHCASYLCNATESQTYNIELGDKKVGIMGCWTSPWRVIMFGSLNDIVESTLVTDVSEASVVDDVKWIDPAPASWCYWAYNHGSKDYKIVTEYIDLAAEMKWPYTLIDWEWNEMSNGGNVKDAIAYAHAKGVKPLIWYNSSTAWSGEGAPGPLFRLNERKRRENEYAWLDSIGVKGIKIDFFDGDNVKAINYCIDLLEDAAKHRILVAFHGATIPRGWQRTYPNLMTVEGVYGAEQYNNSSELGLKAAVHNATLPFTRNVVGSMDYTPGTFSDSQHPHFTSHAHELALYVLFESAIQHMPDRPDIYRNLPDKVREVLSVLPTTWDDTKLISGYPGKDVVIARRKENKWYVAGINGEDVPKKFNLNLTSLGIKNRKVTIFRDGDCERCFEIETKRVSGNNLSIETLPKGGFLIVE